MTIPLHAHGACFALGLLLSGGLLVGSFQDEPQPEDLARASHDRMVRELAEIAKDVRERDPFLGEGETPMLLEDLQSTTLPAPRKLWNVLRGLGADALRLGETEEAIRYYSEAMAQIDEMPSRAWPKLKLQTKSELALAYMRWAEIQNCVARPNSRGCILPLDEAALYEDQTASRKAIELLEDVLEIRDDDTSRWLLNLAYMNVGEYPNDVPEKWRIDPKLFVSLVEFPRFDDVAAERGLATVDLSGGSIVDDFNGDGHLDLITSTWDHSGPMHFFVGDGSGSFEDRTLAAGLEGVTGGLNLVQADYDNDGDLDVLVLRGAWLRSLGRIPNSLLRNDGSGRFVDVTYMAGLGEKAYPTQTAAWADYDNDGDLDLYIGNESGAEMTASAQLFQNQGDGTFVDVAIDAGVRNDRFTKGVSWGDYDGDRLPDLYVSNKNMLNRLYHNNGDGTFTDVAKLQRVQGPKASSITWFWDQDNDGALDLFVAGYLPALGPWLESLQGKRTKTELHALYRGDGEGGFQDVAKEVGLTRSDISMGGNFGDIDGDGWLDFYLGTGYPGFEAIVPNSMYWSRRGDHFADVTMAGGFGHIQKGHAVSIADLDGDGDQDIHAQLGGGFPGDASGNALLENPGFGNHWIEVRLIGVRSNHYGIGARIRVTVGEGDQSRDIYRWVSSGGSFGSSPLSQTIGIGSAERVERLEVYWPTTDVTQVLEELEADQRIEITEEVE